MLAIAKPVETTTYIVTISDGMGCESEVKVTITVDNSYAIKIPNTFTPNGDGDHDRWMIENVDLYPQATLEIYNRWGQVVRTYISGDAIAKGWDGKNSAGVDMEVGTYFYIFKSSRNDNGSAASITIIR
jgi:gliding motility-associated-like protein